METMEEIKAIRVEIKEIYEKLTKKKGEVYNNYLEYVDKNKKNNFFGLDSLHFQNKLFELEYESLTKQYNFIDNRIYCDFYKLFGLITQFLKKNYKDNFDNLLKNKNYPIYKDLEQYKVYDFNTVNDIHHDIIVLIKYLFEKVDSVKNEIEDDAQKMSTGLNIANYIYNFIFSNTVTESNVKLFEDYLKSYHSYHKTVLNNLKEKLELMLKQLDPPPPPGPNEKQSDNDFEIITENKIEVVVPEPVHEPEQVVELVDPESIVVPEPVHEVVVLEPVVESIVEVVEPEPVFESIVESVVPEPVVESVVLEPIGESLKSVIELETIVESIPELQEHSHEMNDFLQNPLHNFKIINIIDYIKDSTPLEVKNHIINKIKSFKEELKENTESDIKTQTEAQTEAQTEPKTEPQTEPTHIPIIKNPSEPIQSKYKNKKNKKR